MLTSEATRSTGHRRQILGWSGHCRGRKQEEGAQFNRFAVRQSALWTRPEYLLLLPDLPVTSRHCTTIEMMAERYVDPVSTGTMLTDNYSILNADSNVAKNLPVDRMQAILDLLSHPLISSLLSLHPNSLALSSFVCPEEWTSWFNWAATDTFKFSESSQQSERPLNSETADPQWLIVLRYYEACRRGNKSCGPDAFATIPEDVREVIEGLSGRSLPRDVGHSFPTSPSSTHLSPSRPSLSHISLPGMSPKKAHEVVEMTAFLKELLLSHASLGDTRYAVDIGAGQVRHHNSSLYHWLTDKLKC